MEQPIWWYFIPVLVSAAGVIIALLGTRLQVRKQEVEMRKFEMDLRNFTGSGPRSALTLDIDNKSGRKGLHSTGWIENPLTSVADEEEDAAVEMPFRSRIPAYFARARITNNGPFTAREITLCLTRIESATDPSLEIETVQPLRWSDTWSFRAEATRKTVLADEGTLTFPTLPAKSYRFCDICFHYDLAGPPRLGRFKSHRIYFAVRNLPSRTYSLASGEYKVTFHLSAEHCEPVEQSFKLHVHLDQQTQPALRVYFETDGEPRRLA